MRFYGLKYEFDNLYDSLKGEYTLERFTCTGYIYAISTITSVKISLAFCTGLMDPYEDVMYRSLNGGFVAKFIDDRWNNGRIMLRLPTNDVQILFLKNKLKQFISAPDKFGQVTEYGLEIYNLR